MELIGLPMDAFGDAYLPVRYPRTYYHPMLERYMPVPSEEEVSRERKWKPAQHRGYWDRLRSKFGRGRKGKLKLELDISWPKEFKKTA